MKPKQKRLERRFSGTKLSLLAIYIPSPAHNKSEVSSIDFLLLMG